MPQELKVRAITLADARRAGLTRWQLKGKSWRRLGPEVYVWAGISEDRIVRLGATLLRLPRGAVFSGLSAAWLHGLDVEPCDPIEVTLPAGSRVSGRAGISVRRALVSDRDVGVVRGMAATTLERTLADLSVRLSVTEAVVHVDSALRLRLTSLKKLEAAATDWRGRPGVAAFRRVIESCEPAAGSQMETRLRMLLVNAGLPRPVAQQRIQDREGRFLGRPDLYYPEQKLGLEFDGEIHRTSLVDDNRRQNRLLAAGIRLLRFTANDIYRHPDSVIDHVRGLLTQAA